MDIDVAYLLGDQWGTRWCCFNSYMEFHFSQVRFIEEHNFKKYSRHFIFTDKEITELEAKSEEVFREGMESTQNGTRTL